MLHLVRPAATPAPDLRIAALEATGTPAGAPCLPPGRSANWLLLVALCGSLLSGFAPAALAGNSGSKALSQETLDDIAKHEAIAAAHTAAAQCLRQGKPDAECEGALLGACKGIAFGKFCGMKH